MRNEAVQPEMDSLLASYFAGEADNAERAQVEAWLNASAENKKYFEASKKAWDASAQLLPDQSFDTDAAWNNLQRKINRMDEPAKTRRGFKWYAAAAIALLTGIAALLVMNNSRGEVETVMLASTTEVLTGTLPDGSMISLNKNSQLRYPSSFTGAQREITLTGEAFFDVSHDAAHPFIIHTDKMDITVLGTSFNVRAYPEGDSVHVSVKTGKVQCVSGKDTAIILPGQYAVYVENGAIRTGTDNDPNRAAYRDRVFRFNNTPLGVAVQQLNDAYNCKIILKNEALSACTFTVTKVFYNEPVENIIDAIEVVYPGITSHKEGNTITLDGTGCN